MAVIAVAAVLGGAYFAARVFEAIPWWVWAAFTVTLVAAIAGGVQLIYLLHRPLPAAVQETWRARAEAAQGARPALPPAPHRVAEAQTVAELPPVQIHHHWHDVSPADVAAVLSRFTQGRDG